MTASIAAHGRCARDGERIETRTGKAMAKVTVAVDVEREREGEAETPPLWLSVIAFGRTADLVAALKKGDPCHVIGRLERQKWNDRRTGEERESWQCVADAVHSHRQARRQHQENGHEAQRESEPHREPKAEAVQTDVLGDKPPPIDDADIPF